MGVLVPPPIGVDSTLIGVKSTQSVPEDLCPLPRDPLPAFLPSPLLSLAPVDFSRANPACSCASPRLSLLRLYIRTSQFCVEKTSSWNSNRVSTPSTLSPLTLSKPGPRPSTREPSSANLFRECESRIRVWVSTAEHARLLGLHF
jgi:hypothetical protein